MKLSLGAVRVLVITFALAGSSCSAPSASMTETGREWLVVEGVENGSFPVCIDFSDKPAGTMRVRNVSDRTVNVDFVATDLLSVSTTGNSIRPGESVTVRGEMVGPFTRRDGNIGMITVVDRDRDGFSLAGPFGGRIAVDVRLIEIRDLFWDETGSPRMTLVNPTFVPTIVRIESVGSYFYPRKEIELEPHVPTTIAFAVAGPAVLPQGVAAEITIKGTECSTRTDLRSKKVRIPIDPSGERWELTKHDVVADP